MTIEDQIKCVERELKFRERCYPNWVCIGKLSKKKANYELVTMREVLKTLERVKQKAGSAQSRFMLGV